jgi:hypothetical protein
MSLSLRRVEIIPGAKSRTESEDEASEIISVDEVPGLQEIRLISGSKKPMEIWKNFSLGIKDLYMKQDEIQKVNMIPMQTEI